MVDMQKAIADECDGLNKTVKELLLRKNKAYGNSALNPVRIFSKVGAVEQLNVRIDDKLSRIARGTDTEAVPEDTELDLLGYFILRRIAKKQAKESPNAG